MSVLLGRRALAALPLAGLALPGCVAAQGEGGARQGFTFRDGIGRRAGGPELPMLGSLGGGFARATRATWFTPAGSVDGFSRADEIWPSRPVPAAGAATPWRRAAAEPAIVFDGNPRIAPGRFDIEDYLDRNPVTGLLIAQDDAILLERYQYDRGPAQRMTSFSMAKTVIALLIGIAQAEGLIPDLDAPAATHAPSLAGTEYGETPIRHLLTMSSGVQFREEYDGADDAAFLGRNTLGGATQGGASAVAPFNTRIAAPGARGYYASAETFVLALVLRGATGRDIAGYMADRLWQPMGAEANASWLLDRGGHELGYMGFQAVLRDYARIGMLMARAGRVGDRQVVPANWVAAMTRSHLIPAQTGGYFGYGYQSWIFPERDSFCLQGVRGQMICVLPARRLVMAVTAVRNAASAETTALWRGVRRMLG